MKIIGIAGNMGSGKDTIAKIMIEEGIADYSCSFASNVKYYAEKLFGVDYKDRTPEVRNILQLLGGKMREIDQNVWVKLLMDQIKWIPDIDIKTVIITDVRYKNEAVWIINQGGKIIFVDADEHTRQNRIRERDNVAIGLNWNEWQKHGSEAEVNYIKLYEDTYVFHNIEHLDYDKLKLKFLAWYDYDKT